MRAAFGSDYLLSLASDLALQRSKELLLLPFQTGVGGVADWSRSASLGAGSKAPVISCRSARMGVEPRDGSGTMIRDARRIRNDDLNRVGRPESRAGRPERHRPPAADPRY